MLYQCAVIGDITLDRFLVLPQLDINPSDNNPGNFVVNLEIGHKIPISEMHEYIGGNAYNVTYGLSLLGINTALIASIGTDDISKYVLESLRDINLNTEHIIPNDKSGINQSTILSINGERVVLSHHKDKDYANLSLPAAEWIYITSLSKGSEDFLKQLINNASNKLVFNPGSYLLKHNLDLINQILPKTEILFVNKEETQYIISSSDEHIPNLIKSLHNMGVKFVALTDGHNGAYVSDNTNIFYLPARKVEKKETTGAGDAFNAAFLANFIQSQNISQALKWGIIQSSSVLREIGSVNGLSSLVEIIEIEKTLEPQKV
jgi:sugar/nucleoside kinase (ribokinase family)